MKINYGYVKSKLDGSENIFKPNTNLNIPEKYSYIKILPEVINQGNLPICVPCSISSFIDWEINVTRHTNLHKNIINLSKSFNDISSNNGMSIKEALKYLKHIGIKVNNENYKIEEYSIVPSIIVAKLAIIMNGPLIVGLPVCNSNCESFWIGNKIEGYHAVSFVGYDKNGFILRNSWGKSYGKSGYSTFYYDDFFKIIEIWTLN